MQTLRELLEEDGEHEVPPAMIALSDQNRSRIDEDMLAMPAEAAFGLFSRLIGCRRDPQDLRDAPDDVLRLVAMLAVEALVDSHVRLSIRFSSP